MNRRQLIVELNGEGNGALPAAQGLSERRHPQEVELDSALGEELLLRIEDGGELPTWVTPTIGSMAKLLQLPAGWNSYGARPIDAQAVARALKLLFEMMRHDTAAPIVAPTPVGGIQLEWHLHGIDL